jgi:hypothetical protein
VVDRGGLDQLPPRWPCFFEICEPVVSGQATLLLRRRDQVGARSVAYRDYGQLPRGVADVSCDHVSSESKRVTSLLI